MERFSDVARFILSANYSSRIIEPLQSRTAVFRFKRLSEKHVEEYLERIIKGEKLHVDKDAISAIYDISGGDLRKATNILQASAALGKITRETVYEVASQAKPQDIREMIDLALKWRFGDARKKLYSLLIDQGLSGEDIIKSIHKEIFDLDIPEEAKLDLIERVGETEFRLNQGGSDDIQLEALLAQFLRYKKNS